MQIAVSTNPIPEGERSFINIFCQSAANLFVALAHSECAIHTLFCASQILLLYKKAKQEEIWDDEVRQLKRKR